MKLKIVLFVLTGIFLMTGSSFCQDLDKLDENNGFKSYKLGSRYNVVYGVKQKQDDLTDKVSVDAGKEKIGNIPLKAIELIYLKDTLVRITVTVEPDYHDPLLEALQNVFGTATKDLSDNEATRKQKKQTGNMGSYFTNRFLWETTRINLEYYYFYPQYSGGAGTVRRLNLIYSLNDFGQRIEKMKKSKTSSKDF